MRLRAWTLRDSGRFPLTPQKNAKGGELRAKRKTAPGIRRSMPGASPALCVGGEDADAALGW